MTSEEKYIELIANSICRKRFCFECFITGGNHRVFVPEDWGELTLLRFMELQGLDTSTVVIPKKDKSNKEHRKNANPISCNY